MASFPSLLRSPHAWVTGAGGFIGRHLSQHLATTGMSVAGIGHGEWPEPSGGRWGIADWLNGDITAASLAALGERTLAPSIVYHLAGGSSVPRAADAPREDFERTVASTANLLDWARAQPLPPRVVLVSSAAVYGDGGGTPMSVYGSHKAMMEELGRSFARQYGLDVAIVRLFSVYGPFLKKQLVWDICRRVALGEAPLILAGSGSEERDWTEVSDVARALAWIGANPHQSPLDVGTGHPTTVADLAAHVVSHWPRRPEVRFTGVTRPGDPFRLVADAAPLAALGFTWSVPLADGLRRTVEWYRQSEALG